jgi:hypothetical protein
MKISDLLQRPFVEYNKNLAETFNPLPLDHKLSEVSCRITRLVLVVFAEIALGILWLTGKAISYCEKHPLIEEFSQSKTNLAPPITLFEKDKNISVDNTCLAPVNPLLYQDKVGWDFESAPYDQNLDPYTLMTIPALPAALGVQILCFLSLPELFEIAHTSNNFNKMSTHYLNVFNNTLRFSSSFNYAFPRRIHYPTYQNHPLTAEELKERQALFKDTVRKLRPTDSNQIICMRVGMTTGTTTLLLHTLEHNQSADFRSEVVSALLEKNAKVDLIAAPSGYLESSPLELARQTKDDALITLLKNQLAVRFEQSSYLV